ncbi:glyoxalase [Nocardia nova]|uniref:Glyoxalase n=1 Tax=Nocardia nova TaxID=37330 RepID=A0A2S6ALW2_9NOCA|nr:glyoxalase [Nocardia nova]PPJ32584.1 glyoxalase [Nocardia nova]PPJ36227.1 glyoxalase [Nocardia nova]
MRILETYARLFVADMDAALPIYERLVGAPADLRFPFEEAEIAAVGGFLVVAGPDAAIDKYRGTVGPVIVDDLSALPAFLADIGGTVVGEPVTSPTGRVVYARHPDGTQVEYVEWTDEVRIRVLGG